MLRFTTTLNFIPPILALIGLCIAGDSAPASPPTFENYCERLQQDVQGRKHGFLAGNVTYYVGGYFASWELKEHETLGLTHPFHHDLRSRGVGLITSRGSGQDNTGPVSYTHLTLPTICSV